MLVKENVLSFVDCCVLMRQHGDERQASKSSEALCLIILYDSQVLPLFLIRYVWRATYPDKCSHKGAVNSPSGLSIIYMYH